MLPDQLLQRPSDSTRLLRHYLDKRILVQVILILDELVRGQAVNPIRLQRRYGKVALIVAHDRVSPASYGRRGDVSIFDIVVIDGTRSVYPSTIASENAEFIVLPRRRACASE